jgi:SNF family Na+-dependent transporter
MIAYEILFFYEHSIFRLGGGAFLIPYIFMVFVIGLPIFFSELFVGQYSGLGPNKAYTNLAPLFQGEWNVNLKIEVE